MIDINSVITPSEMKKLENASQNAGVSLSSLMDNAGEALAHFIASKENKGNSICFLCGKGNNGGDGFVAANLLASEGYAVFVVLTSGEPSTVLSCAAFSAMKNVSVIKDNIMSFLKEHSFEVIVDCIYGTGFRGTVHEDTAKLMKLCKDKRSLKIACDIVSGVCALNGYGDDCVINADYTVTFGARKCGMMLEPCMSYCGEITVADIGIPKKAYQSIDTVCSIPDTEYIKSTLKRRSPYSHKGTYGKLLNISGCSNYVGASILSTLSALRSGVGLCTLASPKYVTDIVGSTVFETTFLPLDDDGEGKIGYESLPVLLDKANESSAVLFGCGCGKSTHISKIAEKLILNARCPLVIDADGINAILDRIDILKNTEASIIITPHPGELARLCNVSNKEALSSRVELALQFAQTYNVTVVAKGSKTVIASPDGSLHFSVTGNAGLSRGGSGDVLAGMISSFCAQGYSPIDSAVMGTYLHGYTADIVAEKKSMQGMLPSDVINELPYVFKALDR